MSDRQDRLFTARSGTQRARWPLRPELAAPLGVCPLPQLMEGVGSRSCSLQSGDVAVLSCCTAALPVSFVGAARYAMPTCRPSVFQAGHIPSWRRSCERYALSPIAGASRWLLLLLSPLLSAAGPGSHLRGLPGSGGAPCPSQASPPDPAAAEPDGRRVLSGGGAADHEVTPQAPLTGSGCREHSYGGFGGGHPHFHPHAPGLQIHRSRHIARGHPSLVTARPTFQSCPHGTVNCEAGYAYVTMNTRSLQVIAANSQMAKGPIQLLIVLIPVASAPVIHS